MVKNSSPLGASAVVVAILAVNWSFADSIIIPSTLTGGYTSDGGYANSPFFQNYYVGHTALAPSERRNFFIFDLAGLTGPVIGARLLLEVPSVSPGYISPDPFEIYHVSSTPYSATAVADLTQTTAEALGVYGSLGTGDVFGEVAVSPADMGTDLVILLTPTAVDAINAAAGGDFVIGGRSPSLSFIPPDELIFSFTDVPIVAAFPRLELLTIPEPSSVMLLGLGLCLAWRRQRT